MADRNVIGMTALLKRLDAVGKTAEDLLDDWPPRTVRNAKEKFAPHKKTGMTSASIQPGRRSKTMAEVRVDGAGAFIEFGTRPHVIRPRTKRFLAWAPDPANRRLSGATRAGTKSSDLIFAREVHHPGTKADPFMLPAGEDALSEFFDGDPVHRRWNKAAR